MTKYGKFKVIDELEFMMDCRKFFMGQRSDYTPVLLHCTRHNGHPGPCSWLSGCQNPERYSGEYQEYWEPEEDEA